jgi:uncharacterized protein YjbI with pentapeptide repeats
MKVTIRHRWNHEPCFEGEAETFVAGVEKAVGEDADLSDADLSDADLSDANLSGANLRDANLRGANLIGANLRDANLRDADLSDSNLRDANLIGANLIGAILSGANLSGADLRDANLSGAYLSGANLIDATVLPDGRTLAEWQANPLEGLCRDEVARRRARDAWGNHRWANCPMHHANGWNQIEDAPEAQRLLGATFVALFDGQHLPKPEPKGGPVWLLGREMLNMIENAELNGDADLLGDLGHALEGAQGKFEEALANWNARRPNEGSAES